MFDINFYKDKKILITGHTGFKGTWICNVLLNMGANITGYALEPPTNPSLFKLCCMEEKINSIIGDIRDLYTLKNVFLETKPEIVIHMAAQPIVRRSYQNPLYTYDVNIMGTVNILECIRANPCVKSFLNITTDKVYKNKEWEWGYRENEELNGFDPYSNSKSCSELITNSYKLSFFQVADTAVSTVRAGNVIGGGDFAEDRIIPDCIRAILNNKNIIIRNPDSIRPYQHVLDAVMAYLLIAQEQYKSKQLEGSYNVGPAEDDCWKTRWIVEKFCDKWKTITGENVTWKEEFIEGPHESNYLKLDCSKIKNKFGWKPCWNIDTAIEKVLEWLKAYMYKEDINNCMECQINDYLKIFFASGITGQMI